LKKVYGLTSVYNTESWTGLPRKDVGRKVCFKPTTLRVFLSNDGTKPWEEELLELELPISAWDPTGGHALPPPTISCYFLQPP
ncbi:hypothetical protein BaRGS_00021291, partial [Batillaria attramentaria]